MAGRILGEISNVMDTARGDWKLPKAAGSVATHTLGSSISCGKPHVRAAVREDQFTTPFQSDAQDPQRASEYAAHIFAHLLEKESLLLPNAGYMEQQRDINSKMRAILIDWLVEVQMKYRLSQDTLFLTVNIIDRYLSVRQVMRKKLQLLGVVAMMIASKYEEIDPPKVNEFAYITDHTYPRQEIVNMESNILMVLEYQIAVPTPRHMLDRLQRLNGCDSVHRSLVEYALELALLDVRFVRYQPSSLVGAAVLMSNEYFGRRQVWSEAMTHQIGCTDSMLQACASDLRAAVDTARTASLQAVVRKYQLYVYHSVADLPARARA